MKITTSTFTLYFPQNQNIRESIFKLEKYFDEFQKPFTLVPLPQDAPVEIPRIIAATIHGHSQLIFNANSVQLKTIFDNDYPQNVDKCLNYIGGKIDKIKRALSIVNDDNNTIIYYSGLSMDIEYDQCDEIENPVNFILKHHFKDQISEPVSEVNMRVALVLRSRYYVNIMLQNLRKYMGQPDERGSFAGLNEINEKLNVTLDINDKYAFDHLKNYVSSDNDIHNVLQITDDFVKKYITIFVKTGELNYDSK